MNVHQNHLMKNTLLGQPPEFHSVVLGWGPEICITNKFPADVDVLVWGPHFEIPLMKVKGAEEESPRDLSFTLSHQAGITHYASGPVLGVEDLEEDKRDCCQGRKKHVKQRHQGVMIGSCGKCYEGKERVIQGIITEWGVSSVLLKRTWHMRRLCRIRRI